MARRLIGAVHSPQQRKQKDGLDNCILPALIGEIRFDFVVDTVGELKEVARWDICSFTTWVPWHPSLAALWCLLISHNPCQSACAPTDSRFWCATCCHTGLHCPLGQGFGALVALAYEFLECQICCPVVCPLSASDVGQAVCNLLQWCEVAHRTERSCGMGPHSVWDWVTQLF